MDVGHLDARTFAQKPPVRPCRPEALRGSGLMVTIGPARHDLRAETAGFSKATVVARAA